MLSDQKVSRLFLIPSLMKNMISYMTLEGISLPGKITYISVPFSPRFIITYVVVLMR
jgi:hypothetical protein